MISNTALQQHGEKGESANKKTERATHMNYISQKNSKLHNIGKK